MAFAATTLLTLANGAARAACAPNSIDVSMTNGARWELCWVADPKKGLVLNQITLTPTSGGPRTLILEQASLAQVLVAYDNGMSNQYHVSDAGLPLTPLSTTDCPGGTLLADGSGNPLLCRMKVPRGYAWRGTGQIQGESLIIFGVSAAGGDTYIQQWIFDDAGTIHPMLGVSGQLDPSRDSTADTGWPISAPVRYATNRFHTAYWRLDFSLGGPTNDLFQQLNYTADNTGYVINQTITDITSEGKFTISPEAKRFWVVKDKVISNASNGQKISFQIVPEHTSVHRGSDAFTGFDIYVTQNKACEQFASYNPTGGGCGADLTQFITPAEALSDPVIWVGTTWHQVPRAEDESDVQTHWQGVILAPRDLTATSPFNN
ncbi:hypothetical protein [Candidatus Methylobacter favarea]|nr:hypothetical protein [Candidatus Methylobacter favarea]